LLLSGVEIHPIRNDEDHAAAIREIEKLWGAAAGTEGATSSISSQRSLKNMKVTAGRVLTGRFAGETSRVAA